MVHELQVHIHTIQNMKWIRRVRLFLDVGVDVFI